MVYVLKERKTREASEKKAYEAECQKVMLFKCKVQSKEIANEIHVIK